VPWPRLTHSGHQAHTCAGGLSGLHVRQVKGSVSQHFILCAAAVCPPGQYSTSNHTQQACLICPKSSYCEGEHIHCRRMGCGPYPCKAHKASLVVCHNSSATVAVRSRFCLEGRWSTALLAAGHKSRTHGWTRHSCTTVMSLAARPVWVCMHHRGHGRVAATIWLPPCMKRLLLEGARHLC
jgi:hypothetical protein